MSLSFMATSIFFPRWDPFSCLRHGPRGNEYAHTGGSDRRLMASWRVRLGISAGIYPLNCNLQCGAPSDVCWLTKTLGIV